MALILHILSQKILNFIIIPEKWNLDSPVEKIAYVYRRVTIIL